MFTIDAMRNYQLTEQQRQELRVAHREAKKSGRAADAYKLNAVILLGSGWTLASVSEALLLDENTLSRYVRTFKDYGIDRLLKTHYKGRSSFLRKSQIEQLKEELESTIHLSTTSVIDYVKHRFGVTYSVSGMRDLLHRLDYEYKKPKLVPGDPDIDEQEIFVDQYEAFMEEKPRDIEVLFVDAVHPEHNTMAAYGWIKRGQKRTVKTNSGRQRLNLHGAMNAETLEVTIIESQTINGDSTVDLLQVLDQKYSLASKILLILDNAKYHYSQTVQEALKNHPRIQLVFLPSYSPNLNLIERLWKFFKKKVLYNTYYESLEAFRKASITFFRQIHSRYANEISSLMRGGFELNYP